MLEIALRETVPEVLPTLMDNCTTALNSSDFDERDNARGILTRLAMKGHEGAKSALESGFMAAIADFSLDALVFLGNYARPNIASAVDTSLEHNMERLVKEGHLNTLTYIAGKSSCSIDARRRAARILGKEERRVENLKYVESHTLDLEIRAIMRAAIEDRQR